MTVRIKPLVWCVNATNDTYESTQGGFTVKHSGPYGWEWRRGHIFGFADSRQGAFDGANERHLYEVSALLEPATHTAQLSAALQLPEVAALVHQAYETTTCIAYFIVIEARPRDLEREAVKLRAALAALKGPQT